MSSTNNSFDKWAESMGWESSSFSEQVGGSHYKRFEIQPVEYIYRNRFDFLTGNVIKYISRWRFKNGIEDLEKAKHYIDMLIELEKKKKVQKTA